MFGTVSAKNLNHVLRYPKEICKNFNNFPIAEYGKQSTLQHSFAIAFSMTTM